MVVGSYGISAYNFLNAQIKIKVFFHIIREGDGSHGISGNILPDLVSRTNQFYSSTGIQFVIKGYDYIDDHSLYNYNYHGTSYQNLIPKNVNADAIDIYILSAVAGGLGVGGLAGGSDFKLP